MHPHTIYLPSYRASATLNSTETLDVIDLRDHTDLSFSIRVTNASEIDIDAEILGSDFSTGAFVPRDVVLRIEDNGTFVVESQIKTRYAKLRITRRGGSCTCAIAATAKGV